MEGRRERTAKSSPTPYIDFAQIVMCAYRGRGVVSERRREKDDGKRTHIDLRRARGECSDDGCCAEHAESTETSDRREAAKGEEVEAKASWERGRKREGYPAADEVKSTRQEDSNK